MGILAVFIIALLISLLFSSGYRNRPSIVPFIIFFLVLFMAGLAGRFWIVPYGPLLWGVAWIPLFFLVLLFAFLFSAPPLHTRRSDRAEAAEAISIFVWLLFCVLLIAVIAGFLRSPI